MVVHEGVSIGFNMNRRPDGTDDIHWRYLGPVVDEESE